MKKKLFIALLVFGTLEQNKTEAVPEWINSTNYKATLWFAGACASLYVLHNLGTKLVKSFDKLTDAVDKTSENLVGEKGLGSKLTEQVDKLTNQTSRLTTTVETARNDVAVIATGVLTTIDRTADDLTKADGHIDEAIKTVRATSDNLVGQNGRIADLTRPIQNIAKNGIHAEKNIGGKHGFTLGSITAKPISKKDHQNQPNPSTYKKRKPTHKNEDGMIDRAIFCAAEKTLVPVFQFLFSKRN